MLYYLKRSIQSCITVTIFAARLFILDLMIWHVYKLESHLVMKTFKMVTFEMH